MKLNLRKLVLGAAIATLPQLMNAQSYDIQAPTEDGYVSDPSIVTANNPYIYGEMKLGKSDAVGQPNTTSAIIPFKLPAQPEGQDVTSAMLKVYVSYGRSWATTNIDLYGLPFVAHTVDVDGRAIFAEDHYAGEFSLTQGSRGAVGIEDDYFSKNVDNGKDDTPRYEETSNDTELTAYINAQYAAGAVEGDWIFLRLSVDNVNMTGSHFFKIEGGDSNNPAMLNIKFDANLSNEKVEKNTLSIYPNPVVNGEFTVSTVGMKSAVEMTIFNVTGKLVSKQSLNAAGNKATVNVNLSQGLYIVQLTDGDVVKTSKMSVK